jgi:integrase
MRKRLTDLVIEHLPPPAKDVGRLEVFDTIVPGLALRVTPNGAKSFVVRGRVKGQAAPIRLTLGDARGMKLSDARREASEVLRACRAGTDPREERRHWKVEAERAQSLRWEVVVETFLAEHARRKKSGHQTEAIFNSYITPNWSGRLLSEITRADVTALLDKLARTKSVYVANRALAAVRKLMNWAAVRGMIPASPVIVGMARPGEIKRDRVLTFDEIRVVWEASDALGHPFRPIIRLLLVTGQRRSEVAAMRGSAIDPDARLWGLAAEDTKAARAHVVPLSPLAVDILQTVPHSRGHLFGQTGERPASGFSKAKTKMDAKLGEAFPAWRFHDLRRTVATHLEDALGISRPVVGSILNHAAQGVTAQVYTRGDLLFERRRALVAWGRFLVLVVGGGECWQKVARIVRPETEADAVNTLTFRSAIMADEAAWSAYVKGRGQ